MIRFRGYANANCKFTGGNVPLKNFRKGVLARGMLKPSARMLRAPFVSVSPFSSPACRLYSLGAQHSQRKTHTFEFFLNGEKVRVRGAQPHTTLIDFLRKEKLLTGTKLACGEGGCGACTVTVSYKNHKTGDITHRGMNSCLVPICWVEGAHVTTVEGISSTPGVKGVQDLHPVQQYMAENFASQCGYCTPGFVMSVFSQVLDSKGQTTPAELEKCVDGNLCRCTGYRSIAAALHKLSADESAFSQERDGALVARIEELVRSHRGEEMEIRGDRCTWLRPVSLSRLLQLVRDNPSAKIVMGNTEVGIERRFGGQEYDVVVCPSHVDEMHEYRVEEDRVCVGAALPLSDLWGNIKGTVEALRARGSKETTGDSLVAMADQLQWFSGTSIRNGACLGGNIMTASPISDLNPVLVAVDAQLHLHSADHGERLVSARDFFRKGYRQVDRKAGEVLVSVDIPFCKKGERVKAFKQARRREDDIAIVTAGIKVSLEEEEEDDGNSPAVVRDCALVYGGVAPYTARASGAEAFLLGKPWTRETVKEACAMLSKDLAMDKDTPGGMEVYRPVLASSLFYKFYLWSLGDRCPEAEASGAAGISHSALLQGKVEYNNRRGGEEEEEGKGAKARKEAAVGSAAPHSSAHLQVSGRAVYTDDIPESPDELHGALVVSDKPHAVVKGVDYTAAVAMEGVHGVFTHRDVPGSNETGDIVKDEQIFASDKVTCVGQPIAIVVAQTEQLAREAAAAVSVTYEELPSLMSIDDAVDQGSFFHPEEGKTITSGAEVDSALEGADQLVQGAVYMGGQEHFYFEPMVTIARPSEGEMHITCSTQNANKTQMHVASALGMPAHRVTCSVKRIGGGFGGKETHTITPACCAAVAATHLNRPVRLLLGRDEDMKWTGKRHPFYGKYKVGFDSEGRITAADVDLVSNGGNFTDLSWPVLERALFHTDNAYKIPSLRVRGRVAKTNTVSNTAFRGFGGPQGMFVTETWMEHIARSLKRSTNHVQRVNLYGKGDTTHYGQEITHDYKVLWDTALDTWQFDQRQDHVQKFNEQHAWKKRGLAMVPSKFGIAFTATFLNQGSALVHAYTDGTVLVTHGGVEMGQGLHTKVQQVAAQALGVPLARVFVGETTTDKIPNASPTAASVGSDLYGMATLYACQELNARLRPYREAMDQATFAQVVKAAYLDRTSLSAQGYYKIPVSGFDFNTQEGTPFNYFTTGVALSEVEIDVLTGDHRALRTDILMDMGKSLNPGIDVGQIEGAFVQGQGLTTVEELVWGDEQHSWFPRGHLKTTGPGAYKIPAMDDAPRQFNVTLMKNCDNPLAVYSSRAVGEPPLFLGSSVYFAAREAIAAARRTHAPQAPSYFRTDSPLTAERIRLACMDHFVRNAFPHPENASSYAPPGSF